MHTHKSLEASCCNFEMSTDRLIQLWKRRELSGRPQQSRILSMGLMSGLKREVKAGKRWPGLDFPAPTFAFLGKGLSFFLSFLTSCTKDAQTRRKIARSLIECQFIHLLKQRSSHYKHQIQRRTLSTLRCF